MTQKDDAHHVVSFALKPVRARPERGEGVDVRIVPVLIAHTRLEANSMTKGERTEMTHDLKTRLAIDEIDCSEVCEHVHRSAGIVPEKLVNFEPRAWFQHSGFVPVLGVGENDVVTKFADDELEKGLRHLGLRGSARVSA